MPIYNNPCKREKLILKISLHGGDEDMVLNANYIIILITVIILIMLIVIFVTRIKENHHIIKEIYSLGTINQLKVYGKNSEKAIEEAFNRLNEIDDKMSVFKNDSEVSKINQFAGKKTQAVSEDTYFVIENAVKYCAISEGAFDITVRPLAALWNIGSEEPVIPSSVEIENKLKRVNYKDIILDEDNKAVFLKNRNQEIDLGGIAKGYAADEVKNILVKNNIKNALINLGGNIFALGNKVDGTPWIVGIQNPIEERGEFVGTISVVNKSVVTSGNYERYFVKDGKRYHHIINPKTGYPVEGEIISATIISDKSIDGDGLSTGVYIMGLYKAIKLIEETAGVDAIFITKEKEIYVTSGIRENFILTNNEFSYRNIY